MNAASPPARLTAAIMADPALTARLYGIENPDAFIAEAAAVARAHGLPLATKALQRVLTPDPIGVGRWTTPVLLGAAWPPAPWLPIQVETQSDALSVDWACFGTTPLTAPFFEDSLRRALGRPLNRLFRYRTNEDDFLAGAATADSLTPDGFIFHMSRCGSTLSAQMMAALPGTVVIAEAPAIDSIVQTAQMRPPAASAENIRLLRAIVDAYGRRRAGDETRFVIKLDAWHSLALPLFRQAFPATPWVFLFRDPVEVLVSQMRQRGLQTVPEYFAPGFFGIGDIDGMPPEEYCARVLASICGAAAGHADGGQFINYRDLPQAVEQRVLPHFGMPATEKARAMLAAAAQRDAKPPGQPFHADSADKQQAASPAIRAAARHLDGVYRRLDALAAEHPASGDGRSLSGSA